MFAKYLLRISAFIRSEGGNVESALVMIPLISVFLVTLQLIATVNLRNLDLTTVQNKVSSQAVSQEVNPDDQVLYLDSHDLFEKLRILIIKSEREIPRIFPGINSMIGGKKLKTTGAAVIEESEQCNGGYGIC